MDQDKMYRIWRVYLIVVNILFEICGAIAIFVGFYVLFGAQLSSLSAVFFVGGALVVLLSMLGYLGAHKENPKLLKIYAGIMIFLLILKVIAFIYLMLQPVHHLKDSDIKTLYKYYDQEPTVTAAVDKIQSELHCCGYGGPQSVQKMDGTYPASCCIKGHTTCFVPYAEGCASKVLGAATTFSTASKISSVVGFVLHLFCVFGAFYMLNVIKKKAGGPDKFQYGNF